VQLAKNDFGLVYGSVLQKNCGFRFGFGCTKLTAASVFWFRFLHSRCQITFVLRRHLSLTPFRFLNFEIGSVFREPISDICVGFCTPLKLQKSCSFLFSSHSKQVLTWEDQLQAICRKTWGDLAHCFKLH